MPTLKPTSRSAVAIHLTFVDDSPVQPPWPQGPLGDHSLSPAEINPSAAMTASSVQQLRPSLLATIVTTNQAGKNITALGEPYAPVTWVTHIVITTATTSSSVSISSANAGFNTTALSSSSGTELSLTSFIPSATSLTSSLASSSLSAVSSTTRTSSTRPSSPTPHPSTNFIPEAYGVIGPEDLGHENHIISIVAIVGTVFVVSLSVALVIGLNRYRLQRAAINVTAAFKSFGTFIVNQFNIYMGFEVSSTSKTAAKPPNCLGPVDLARKAIDDNLLLRPVNNSGGYENLRLNQRQPGMSANGMQGMWM